jgi:orotidine-5'-phosphate decarboxylase
VFADAKLHDIPAQVEGAMTALARRGVSFVTIHASGGPDMVKAAVAAAPEGVTVLAVTVLTSLGDGELARIGLVGPAEDAVERLAEVALDAGADGLVCSPLEVTRLRREFGTSHEGGPLLVVPGIRPAGDDAGDQRRTTTPAEAIAAGADLLVVGRPITAAADPGAAARSLLKGVGR